MMICDGSACTGCGACYNICPQQCISMIRDNEGFIYPIIDEDRCINCMSCIKNCPCNCGSAIDNTSIEKKHLSVYAGKSRDAALRKKSSSGAVFSLLSKIVIDSGGCVCGAVFDEEFNVHHTVAYDIETFKGMRGSKYVQSEIYDILPVIEKELQTGKPVLFSGTPCQIAGLGSFLGKEYDNLISVEVVCHGAPSPKVWGDYVKSKKSAGVISYINFRDKKDSWKSYSISFNYKCGKIDSKFFLNDAYMKGFISDLYLRKSCYNCMFKENNSFADIELGDCWGIENICKELDDDIGTSVIVIKSNKGKRFFDKICDSIDYTALKYSDVVKYNPSIAASSDRIKLRESFFEKYSTDNFECLVWELTEGTN